MNNMTEKIIGKSLKLMCFVILLITMSVNGSKKFKDSDIISTIETEFIFDPVVDFNTIDVECKEGIVTLNGNVNSIRAAQRAEHIAEILLGVKAVVNILHVETPAVPDDSLEGKVENAFLLNPAIESFEIEVSAKNGEVMLKGNVQSWQEKYIAEEVSKGVSGVKKVNNKITVTLSAKRSDFEIKNDIRQRMANDVMIDDLLLEVQVHNAHVILSGKVGSLAEKKRVIRNAYVAGVMGVSYNKLKIDWWARNKLMRKDFDADRSDKEIEHAVKTAYLYDPRIMTINPEVEVENGLVTLRGTVTSLLEKITAEEDARNVSGVIRVKNHLKVRSKTSMENETLERKIASALSIDPLIDRFEIAIDAYTGCVALSGTVSSMMEKRIAGQRTEAISGVTEVINKITVEPTKIHKDWKLENDVNSILKWDPYLERHTIKVWVNMGMVYLYGQVDNPFEIQHAEEVVSGIDGVIGIKNYLTQSKTVWTFRSDNEIENRIQRRLKWNRFVNERKIDVEVQKGTATLDGSVRTWEEYLHALICAFSGGARGIQMELKVREDKRYFRFSPHYYPFGHPYRRYYNHGFMF